MDVRGLGAEWVVVGVDGWQRQRPRAMDGSDRRARQRGDRDSIQTPGVALGPILVCPFQVPH